MYVVPRTNKKYAPLWLFLIVTGLQRFRLVCTMLASMGLWSSASGMPTDAWAVLVFYAITSDHMTRVCVETNCSQPQACSLHSKRWQANIVFFCLL